MIFPCGRPPKHRPPPISVDTLSMKDSLSSSTYSAGSSATFLSAIWSPVSDRSDWHLRETSGPTTLPGSLHSASSIDRSSSFSDTGSLTKSDRDHHLVDLQDHSRLKAAWDAMLAQRFLTPQLTTVLPFYLSSSFVDIRTHPPLQIPMLPNSRLHKKGNNHDALSGSPTLEEKFDPDALFDLRTSGRTSAESTGDNYSNRFTKISQRTVPSWSHMHLAKTVQTISGCKESIWDEYEKLYINDPRVPPVTRTSRPKHIRSLVIKPSVREDFERCWSNWEK